ncbi:MAG: DUF2695 domain-containing protein [Planctomycetes bacterium]|nr:DUF2695 domain-containing protein [Planctomycetota bacterium]
MIKKFEHKSKREQTLSRAWSLLHDSGSDADLAAAIQLLARHLAARPRDAEGFCLLSEALLARGRADQAHEAALEALKWARPDDAEPYFRAGLSLFELAGKPDEEGPASLSRRLDPVLHFLEAALEIPPARHLELIEEALAMFQDAIERRHPSCGPHFWAGLCLLNLGRTLEALRAFEQASALEGTPAALAEAWLLMGLTLEELGRFKEAGEAYRIALAHAPDHPGARLRLEWLDPGAREGFLEASAVRDLCRRIERELEEKLESCPKLPPAEEGDAGAEGPAGEEECGPDLPEACSGKIEIARAWASERGLDPAKLERFLLYHGAVCDCEVVLNLEARLNLAPEGGLIEPGPGGPAG